MQKNHEVKRTMGKMPSHGKPLLNSFSFLICVIVNATEVEDKPRQLLSNQYYLQQKKNIFNSYADNKHDVNNFYILFTVNDWNIE